MSNPSIAQIQRATSGAFGIDPETMKQQLRPNAYAHPRQAAMYLSQKLTKHSLAAIGRQFGGRHHTTTIHAIRAVEARMGGSLKYAVRVEIAQWGAEYLRDWSCLRYGSGE